MPSNPIIKPISLVLCEDVRREADGRFILIGTYDEGPLVREFPAEVYLGIYMQFEILRSGTGTFELKFQPSKGEARGLQAELTVKEVPEYIQAFARQGLQMTFEEAGAVEVFFRSDDEDSWQLLRRFSVGQFEVDAEDDDLATDSDAG